MKMKYGCKQHPLSQQTKKNSSTTDTDDSLRPRQNPYAPRVLFLILGHVISSSLCSHSWPLDYYIGILERARRISHWSRLVSGGVVCLPALCTSGLILYRYLTKSRV